MPFDGLPFILFVGHGIDGDEFGFGDTYAVNSGTSRVFPDGLDNNNKEKQPK